MPVLFSMVVAAAVAVPNPAAMKLQLQDAYVAEAEAGGSVALSALVLNPNTEALTLVGASTPMAGQTVLQHYVKDADGIVQLKPLNQLPIPPKTELVLAPGALELQLVGLASPLQAGTELPLTLKFADGTHRTVRIAVKAEGQ